jgi:transcriptional regulator of met regulon
MNIILERVNNVCKSVREDCQDLITFKKLISKTRSAFKKHEFDLSLKTKKEKDWDTDKFYVVAYYDSENDAQGETPIEVIVHHNLDGTEEFGLHQVTSFLIEIYDAVVHEFRHQYQSMRRDFIAYETKPVSPYNEYLADQDEIDAYSVSIAIELLRTMDSDRAKRRLSKISVLSKMRTGANLSSPMLRAYIGHFGLNEITRIVAKKVYRHLDRLDKQHIFM